MLMADSKAGSKEYKFDTRRKYDYVMRYKVIEKPPLEKLKDDIKKIFEKKKKPKTKLLEEKKPKKAGRQFNLLLIAVTITIAVLLIIGGVIFLTFQQAQAGYQPGPIVSPDVETTITGSGVISGGDRTTGTNIAYVTMAYSTAGMENHTFKLSVYNDPIPSEVFLLSSDRYDAESYPQFSTSLKSILEKKGISVNEIDLELLETIPRGAIVIIPSGYIPQELLGVDSTITVNELMGRGVVVVYVGLPFDKMLENGIPKTTPTDVFQKTGIRFDESSSLSSRSGFSLFQPFYRAEGSGSGVSNLLAYGSVSIVKRSGGAIIFLPQTLDGGWREDPYAAAEDISRIIYETPWTETVTEPKYYYSTENGDNVIGMFTNSFKGTRKSIKIEFEGYDDEGTKIERYRVVNVDKQTKGNLYISGGPSVAPTDITEYPIRIDARLMEDSPEVELLYFIVENATSEVGERVDLGERSVQAQIPFDVPIHLTTGEYIASIIDDESNVYAQSYLKVVSVEPVAYSISGNEYTFRILQDGSPKKVNEVTVTVDDGKYGEYTFEDASIVIVDLTQATGGEGLPAGTHTFTFKIGKLEWTIPLTKGSPAPPLFADPIFLGTLVLSAVIVGLGVYFASKETINYQIDIPDFPPVARTRISLKKRDVLGIFEKVNEDYKWAEVPLTVSEIKSGFRNILYRGQPIYISDYNVEFLMDTLKADGNVKESMGYYGLSSWEKKTGKTMDYLSLFRKIRDVCVNNAVPFTRKGESKDCDTEITAMGQEMHVHLYDRHGNTKELVRNVLETVKKGITVVVFEGERDKREFENLLRSPSRAMLLLKMEQNTSSVLLLNVREFDKMIKEIKEV